MVKRTGDPRDLGTIKEFQQTLAKPQGTATGAPSLANFGAKCGRCATSINDGEKYCAVCAPIIAAQQAPKPTMIVREVVIVKEKSPETRGEE